MWGHCSQVLVCTSMWGTLEGCTDNGTFPAVFPSIWASWDLQTGQNKDNAKMTNRPSLPGKRTQRQPRLTQALQNRSVSWQAISIVQGNLKEPQSAGEGNLQKHWKPRSRMKTILTTPTFHVCNKYAPKICHVMGVRMA